jgi:putative ABC transport system permease protein
MKSFSDDVRFAVRMMLKNPGFTAVALITLVLGIGANTAIFSVVNAVLLRSLPYQDPGRLLAVYGSSPQQGMEQWPLCAADVLDLKTRNDVFEKLAVYSDNQFTISGAGDPEQVHGMTVSSEFFQALGVSPLAGRVFIDQDGQPGTDSVVVISQGLWRRRFGSAPGILGQAITLHGRPSTVVGVMPSSFEFLSNDIDLWVSFKLDPPGRRGPFFLYGLGRLKPGATTPQARAQLDTIARLVQDRTPNLPSNWTFTAEPLNELLVGDMRPALLALLGAVGFVLLIASVNVASLMLARSAAREKEIAIRKALGASRLRIARQLLTESLFLALIGGAAGLAVAVWGAGLLAKLAPGNIPRLSEISIDGRVLSFTLIASLLSGAIFGLVPAFRGSRSSIGEMLKEGGRSDSGGALWRRLRGALVIAEIALSLMLLVGAGLLIKSLVRLQNVSPGFASGGLLTMGVQLPAARYSEPGRAFSFYKQLIERVDALPGVQSAAATASLPPNNLQLSDSFSIQEHPVQAGEPNPVAPMLFVTPNYFRTLGVPLFKGRCFNDSDTKDSAPVVLINETLARKFFAGEDPIGKALKEGGAERPDNVWMTIVGVVGDIKYQGLDAKPEPQYYMPLAQNEWRGMFLVVRASSAPAAVVPAIKEAVRSLDQDLAVANVSTMDALINESVGRPRFRSFLFGVFAIVAVVLAAVGIYGVMAYSVSERRHEFGIRMALGARPADLLRMVVGRGLALSSIGAAVGLAGAFVLTRVLSSLLFEVSATDGLVFGSVPVFLSIVALLASYVPARRATRVDPIAALRYQ